MYSYYVSLFRVSSVKMSHDQRRSDRNKTDKKEEDHTLSPPLQQIEKLKSKPFTSEAKAEASGSAGKSETSAPAKVHSSTPVKTPLPVTECDLD